MGWSLSPTSSILTLMIIKYSIDPTQETSKNSKSSKTQQKATKNITRTAKPANLGSQRWSSQATRPSSFLSQARKPTKTAKAAKHNNKTTKIIGRTTKPANLGLQGCGPTR